jgi:hypothetical protein
MSPDDERHGTEAGNEQHLRDNEDPCLPCYEGKLKAARRRNKRKTMGYTYTQPVGQARQRIQNWRDAGASYDDIVTHLGIEQSLIWAVATGKRDRIYTRTAAAILRTGGHPVTTIGITRRLQALAWLGWSVDQVAEAAGVHPDTIADARREPREFMAARVKASIRDAYERMHMVAPAGSDKWERAGVTRVRNHARRLGWLPPLAWTEIDDQREQPVTRRNTNDGGGLPWRELLAEWEFLTVDCSLAKAEALDRLGITSDAIRNAERKRDAAETEQTREAS